MIIYSYRSRTPCLMANEWQAQTVCWNGAKIVLRCLMCAENRQVAVFVTLQINENRNYCVLHEWVCLCEITLDRISFSMIREVTARCVDLVQTKLPCWCCRLSHRFWLKPSVGEVNYESISSSLCASPEFQTSVLVDWPVRYSVESPGQEFPKSIQ